MKRGTQAYSIPTNPRCGDAHRRPIALHRQDRRRYFVKRQIGSIRELCNSRGVLV